MRAPGMGAVPLRRGREPWPQHSSPVPMGLGPSVVCTAQLTCQPHVVGLPSAPVGGDGFTRPNLTTVNHPKRLHRSSSHVAQCPMSSIDGLVRACGDRTSVPWGHTWRRTMSSWPEGEGGWAAEFAQSARTALATTGPVPLWHARLGPHDGRRPVARRYNTPSLWPSSWAPRFQTLHKQVSRAYRGQLRERTWLASAPPPPKSGRNRRSCAVCTQIRFRNNNPCIIAVTVISLCMR